MGTYFESELELAKLPTGTAEISIPKLRLKSWQTEFKLVKSREQLQLIPWTERSEKPWKQFRNIPLH